MTSELFCIECTEAGDPLPHLGRSHDANDCKVQPEGTMGWGGSRKEDSVP